MKRPFIVLAVAGLTIFALAMVGILYMYSASYKFQFNITSVPETGNPAQFTAISATVTAKAATNTPIPTPSNLDARFFGQDIDLAPINVGAGAGKLNLNISLPDGYALNGQSPFTLHIYNNEVVSVNPQDNDLKVTLPPMPVVVPITLKAGQSMLIMDTHVYYCEAVNDTLCYPARLRFIAPITVSSSGKPDIAINYTMVVPKAS